MKIDWLFEKHAREWLDFNMKKSHITSEELAEKLHYEGSTVARHRAARSAIKIKDSTEFIRACTKVFEKDSELAECTILLNLDYLHDSNEEPFYEEDQEDNKTRAEKNEFVQEIFRFVAEFKNLQIYECNYLVRYFNVFYYIDSPDWAFLCMWAALNEKGRSLIQGISDKMSHSVVKNGSYIHRLDIYSEMKTNTKHMKYDFRKNEKEYLIDIKENSKKTKGKLEGTQKGLSKDVLLEEMIAKFIGGEGSPPNVSCFEIEKFGQNMRSYLTMDDDDWNWLITLGSLSTEDKVKLQDKIYDLTAKEEFIIEEAAEFLKNNPGMV